MTSVNIREFSIKLGENRAENRVTPRESRGDWRDTASEACQDNALSFQLELDIELSCALSLSLHVDIFSCERPWL